MSTKGDSLPKVCFCGRSNVGKSSLFNRLVGRKKALVLDQPGVTRDVYRHQIELDGIPLEIADLAGLELWGEKTGNLKSKMDQSNYELKKLATKAALDYLNKSDLILFVIDARAELTPLDEDLGRLIRVSGKPVQVVLSKVEGKVGDQMLGDVATLGFDEPLMTSAEHNTGIETLREKILQLLGIKKTKADEDTAEEKAEKKIQKNR